ncbi:hypothetical protein Nepgr_018814 [Nepenthes gracilis]|uniref:Uncharacterized protein n=1 Tax=Nepenthes gracilis TaxID=150966 RepID=A0AAD3SSV3_NEPGR|nr:hypothetical protein Nepgr_018814 [Nepenthes gracilis]
MSRRGIRLLQQRQSFFSASMNFFAYRVAIFLFCIGSLLAIQPKKVSGLTSKDLSLRRRFHTVEEMSKNLHTSRRPGMTTTATAPSLQIEFDQLSKRAVRRGPDPIHNRC